MFIDYTQCAGDNRFKCQSGFCISREFVCNNVSDCQDSSDEADSLCKSDNISHAISETIAVTSNCSKDAFRYSNEKCLNFEKVCDGVEDCDDDEGLGCIIACAQNDCEHMCFKTPKGSICDCFEGFEIRAENHKRCTDVDECLSSPCSQVCKNSVGSFKCSCFDGYTLASDGFDCKAQRDEPKFIYLANDQVRVLDKK
jgi:hypothetical protein